MSTLHEFLETGRLGGIGVDFSQEMVRERWGDPDDVSIQKNPAIWKYGTLQLSFHRGRSESQAGLKSLHLAFDSAENPPGQLAIQGWWPSSETSVEEFRRHLAELGIAVQSRVDSWPSTHLILTSGARVTFVGERLQSLHWTSRKEPQAKQVTVFVPTSELELISKLADESKLTVSALCSKWISEHLSELSKVGSI